jgi:hypothetical protein
VDADVRRLTPEEDAHDTSTGKVEVEKTGPRSRHSVTFDVLPVTVHLKKKFAYEELLDDSAD